MDTSNKELYLSLIVTELREEFDYLSASTLTGLFMACVWRLQPGDALSLALDTLRHLLRQPPGTLRKAFY